MAYTPVNRVCGFRWTRCYFCEAWMKTYYEVKSASGKTRKVSKGCLARLGLSDADFDNPNGSKPWKPKPELIPYEKLVTGHKFKVVSVGTLPEGTHYWCAFCGGRLRHPVEIIRDDGKRLIVGSNCVGRVGLRPEVVPHEAVPKDAEKMDIESVGKSEKEVVSDTKIDPEIWEMLNDLGKE